MHSLLRLCLRYFSYGIIIVIILAALLLQSARLTAPHLTSFLPAIESFISDKTQTNTTIGDIDGYWYGLTPHIILRDVMLAPEYRHDTLSSEPLSMAMPLSVAYAEFKVDLLSSFFQWQWVWEKIAVSHVSATIVQSDDSLWSLAGFSLPVSGDDEWQYQNPIDIVRNIPDVDIENISIQIIFSNNKTTKIDIPKLNVETDNTQSFQRFSAALNVDDRPVLSFISEDQSISKQASNGGVGQRVTPYSTGFLSVTEFPLHLLSNVLPERLSSTLPQWFQEVLLYEKTTRQSYLNGEFWLDFSHQDQLSVIAKTTAQLSLSSLKNKNKPLAVDMFVQSTLDKYGNLSVALDDIVIDEQKVLLNDVVFSKEGEVALLKIKSVNVESWSSWLQSRLSLPAQVSDTLAKLSLEGVFSEVQVVLNDESISQSIVSANVKGFAIEAFDNIPGFKNVDGYLETGMSSGFVNMSSQRMQFFPSVIYDNPFVFDEISGQVAWRIDDENNSLIVNSNVIDGQSAFGEAVGQFLLAIPLEEGHRKSEFTLHLGLKNSNARYHRDLIPNKVPEDIRTWLASSLRKGRVEQAGFVYRGGFSGDDNSRSFQVFVNANETDLAYSDDWPMLSNIEGQVVVDNEYMSVAATQARIFNEPLNALSVVWSGNGNEQLHIQTSARLPAKTGLRLLTETKLRNGIGKSVSGLGVTGSVDTDINILISPKERNVNDKQLNDWQKIRIHFLENTITLPAKSFPSLVASSLQGEIYYSSENGLSADSLDMSLFGEQLSLSVNTLSQGKSESQLRIDGRGVAAISDLSSWIKRPEMDFFSGQLPYQFTLNTPFSFDDKSAPVSEDASISLTANSTLQGLAIDLPAPFNKDRLSQRNMTLESTFSSLTTKHSVKVDGGIASKLLMTDKSVSGFLSVNKSFNSPVEDNVFAISANVKNVILDEWVVFSDKYSSFDKPSQLTKQTVSQGTPKNDEINFIYDIDIGTLSVKDKQFNDLGVMGERANGQWRSQFNHALAAGELTVYDDVSTPVNIALEYLHLTKKESKDEGVVLNDDPLANVDLSWLKPASVSIKQLTYDKSDFGQWRLRLNPLGEGIQIRDIHATFSGMTLSGQEGGGAELFWRTQSASNDGDVFSSSGETQFAGKLQGAGVQELFKIWGGEPVLTSKQTSITGDFSWLGSPAAFSIEAMRGSLAVQLSDGVFVQNTGAASSGILKLLGLFNFNIWARRLQLDFSDFYKKGVAYDTLNTRFLFDEGNIYFQQPLVVKAPSSEFTMAGTIDYLNEDIDTVLVTTLPVGGNLTFATALVAGLPTAVGVFIFNKVFKSQVDKVSSLTYGVKGNWNDPEVKLINLFDNKLIYDESIGPSAFEVKEQGIN